MNTERTALQLLDKAEADMRQVGAWDHCLAGLPAGGVQELITDLRAALAAKPEAPADESVVKDSLITDIAQPEAQAEPVARKLVPAEPTPAKPEGCTPADARMLREANGALAVESHALQEVLAELYEQVKQFVATEGEADFYTGRALAILSKVRPLEYQWPFSDKTADDVLGAIAPAAPDAKDARQPLSQERLDEIEVEAFNSNIGTGRVGYSRTLSRAVERALAEHWGVVLADGITAKDAP